MQIQEGRAWNIDLFKDFRLVFIKKKIIRPAWRLDILSHWHLNSRPWQLANDLQRTNCKYRKRFSCGIMEFSGETMSSVTLLYKFLSCGYRPSYYTFTKKNLMKDCLSKHCITINRLYTIVIRKTGMCIVVLF